MNTANWCDDNKITDESEIRVGTPILYCSREPQIDLTEGRVEAVGWDWVVIRCREEDGSEWLALVTDMDDLRYNCTFDPILESL